MTIFPNWSDTTYHSSNTADWYIPPDRFYASDSSTTSATTIRGACDTIFDVYYGFDIHGDMMRKKKIAKMHNKLKLNEDMYKL